ncbi:F-box family protein [Forsythia ovata]|uniref:F-box family protein n=1 Tax=Forsythia ovata TaxID=205694 RepID=A0ABD1TQ94_9LAMI
MEPPSILTLLTGLLLKIISLLTDDCDRKSFRSTCKVFHRVDSLHRTHLRVFRPEFLSLVAKIPSLDSHDLSDCPRIDDGTIPLLLSSIPSGSSSWAGKIKRLNLSRCTGLRFPGLQIVVGFFVNLESVDVSYCSGFGNREAASLSCLAGLRELNFNKRLYVTDVWIG